MCGLCGVVELGRPPDVETAERMAALLDHRGPDGRGSFSADDGVALGHRRLAIIDLSAAGIQPLASEDGRIQLLHNGEIYNYVELRRELEGHGHGFRTATDTEVVLRAYEQWGERCVERFNGMWAIALWDGRERRLFCSRDRFGIKPFYYRLTGGRLAFASELKAFRAERDRPLRPNMHAVRDYLEQGYVDHLPETFFAGIRPLPPAHSLAFDAGGLRIFRHWQLEGREPPEDPELAVRDLFGDAVRIHLRSDVAIGTALSGGLDSSAVVCTIARLLEQDAAPRAQLGARQRTFTVFFEDAGYDERPYAEAVVEAVSAAPHWISFGERELVDVLPQVIEAQDEPFGSSSIVAQWFVMREARAAGVKVMLDGQGGDEVLAGYPTTFSYRFADLLRHGHVRELGAELGAYRRLHGAGTAAVATALATPFLPAAVRWRLRARRGRAGELLHPDLRRRAVTPEPSGSPYRDRLRTQYHLILSNRGLPELLRYEDRNSMAHSVEARVPFLDHRLVELLYSLDPRSLVLRGMTKLVLRRALAATLPARVRERVDKLGFVTPGARFFRGALGELAHDVFSSASCAERGFIDAAAARRRLAALRSGATLDDRPLWRALSLELWARTFLDTSRRTP